VHLPAKDIHTFLIFKKMSFHKGACTRRRKAKTRGRDEGIRGREEKNL
jgi:hypothetical protein